MFDATDTLSLVNQIHNPWPDELFQETQLPSTENANNMNNKKPLK